MKIAPQSISWMRMLVAVLFLASAYSNACQICLPFPSRSLADELIEARHIVLCRENPEKPFSLGIVKVLKGGSSPAPIDLFLDSSTRRILAENPERSVVCVYNEQAEQAQWKRVATLSPELTPIMDHILSHTNKWKRDPTKRPAYFSQFLGAPNHRLSTLAHLEVARAPYDTIKSLAGTIAPVQIRKFLTNIRMLEWHALYILLLAQSEDPEDHLRIREAAESHAKYSLNLQTAAWATAYIEIAREEALDFFDERYLRNPARANKERAAILAAYSVHGTNGHTDLRPRIVRSYTALAETHPGSIPLMVEDLIKWKEEALCPRVFGLLSGEPERFNLEQTVMLRNYLRSFDTPGEQNNTNPGSPDRMMIWIILALLLLPVALKASSFWKHPTRTRNP